MGEFRMPSLGADMDCGTVTEWRIAPGDQVHRGQIVAVVETDKADIDVEVFEDGTVTEILVPVGREVAVGTPLALLSTPERAPDSAPKPMPRVTSPVVRRLAERMHVDLATVHPSGPSGTVRRRDVEAAAVTDRQPRAAPARAPQPDAAQPRIAASPLAKRRARELGIELSDIAVTTRPIRSRDLDAVVRIPEQPRSTPQRADRQQRAIARLMERSKREIPHYYLSHDIDCHALLGWIESENARRPVEQRLLPAAALLRAVVIAAAANPDLNGHYVDGMFVSSAAVHLGVAIATRGGGLVAPVIPDAQAKSLDVLMAELRALVNRTRRGELRSSDLEAATLTVTNLGEQGVGSLFGVIVPPQVAIVGFGRIDDRTWAAGGMVGVRPVVTATLSADHRVSDGHRGARFLRSIERTLNHPEELP